MPHGEKMMAARRNEMTPFKPKPKPRTRDEGGNFGPSAKETPQTKGSGTNKPKLPWSPANEQTRLRLGMSKSDFKKFLAGTLKGSGGMKSPKAPKPGGK